MQNHIGLALRNLQGTLRDVTSTDARRRMDEALMGLQGARLQNDMYRQGVSDQRYQDETAYGRGRDALGDMRYKEKFGFEKEQAEAENARANERLGIDRKQLGLTQQRYTDERNRYKQFEEPVLERGMAEFKQQERPSTRQDLMPPLEHRHKALEEAGAYDVMLKAIGAEEDPKTGQLMRGGKPIPLWELQSPQNKKNLQRITMSSLLPDQDSEFRAAMIEDKIEAGEKVSEKDIAFLEKVKNATPEQRVGIIKQDLANMNATLLALESEGADPAIIDHVKRNYDRQSAYLNTLAKVGDKDTRGTFEKDATFLSQVTGMSPADAANAMRTDKTLGERMQLAKAQIDSIQGRFLPPEEEEAAIQEVLKTMGLSNPETMGLPRGAAPKNDKPQGIDPNNIEWD
jgi:hypothetical protein